MAAINPIPERTINYRVYDTRNGNAMIGIATVDLPDLEAMTDTVSGAGIAGEVDSPTLGHFGSMTLTINWRTITGDATRLNAQRVQELEFRASQQINDAARGELKTQAIRIVTRCTPKNLSMGSLEVSAASDSSSEFEVTYLKIFIENRETVELDKYNFKYVVNGEDFLKPVRRDLGMD